MLVDVDVRGCAWGVRVECAWCCALVASVRCRMVCVREGTSCCVKYFDTSSVLLQARLTRRATDKVYVPSFQKKCLAFSHRQKTTRNRNVSFFDEK